MDVKINDLSAAGSVTDSMQLETDIGGITPNKVTALQIKTYCQSDIDHGSIDGLTDDDHTQYSLADGTRWTTTPTASRAVISDGSGNLVVSAVTSTELGYLDGVTSAIQTQLDAKFDADGDIDHGGINGLGDDDHTQYSLADGTRWTTTNTANRVPISDGSGNLVVSSITDTELSYLDNVSSNIQTQLDSKYDTDTDVDHDATTNFVANEHINHTSVTLTAGEGLSGGGDISSNRSFSLDVNGLTEDSTPASGDYFVFYDSVAGEHKKIDTDDLPGGGTSTFTGLTDTPSSYSSQGSKIVAVNSGETALEFIDAPSGVTSGSTLPGSPTAGQLHLHTPTGRTWLMQYNGSNWRPIIQYGDSEIYVEPTATGSTDYDDGGTVGTALDFSWISKRLPATIQGSVDIYVAAGNYTGEDDTMTGFILTVAGKFFNVRGAKNTVYASKAFSSIDSAKHVVTFTSTVSSASRGTFMRNVNEASLDGNDWARVLDSALDGAEYTCVFPVRSSSGSTVTLPGTDDLVFERSNSNASAPNWHFYTLTSRLACANGLFSNVSGVRVFDINFETGENVGNFSGKNVTNALYSGCHFEVTGTTGNFRIDLGDGVNNRFHGCLFENNNNASNSNQAVFRCVDGMSPSVITTCYMYHNTGSSLSGAQAGSIQSPGRITAYCNGWETDGSGADVLELSIGGAMDFGFSNDHKSYVYGTTGNNGVYATQGGKAIDAVAYTVGSGVSNTTQADATTYGIVT